MKQYSRELLLSFAEKESCRRIPDDLDPALWRNSPSPDIIDGGVGGSAKFTGRRDREYHHELPEWRSRASANGGLLSHQGPLRRKNYDEEGGHSLYPARGPSNWEGNHVRNHDRAGLQGPGQARWDHRSSIDRERERGGRGHNWDGAEDSVSRPRYGWNASEHDGLLGSGGGLRGAYPGGAGHGPDRGGRGIRNHNTSESRSSKLMGSRNDSDSLDGETFGEKNSTEDRAEEERRRRESFESMRKEQQRLKEQKKQQEKDQRGGYAVEEHFDTICDTQVSSSATPAVAPTPRPLVPPGFSQSSLQKHAIKKENKEQETREEHVKSDNHNSSSVQPKDNKVDPIVIACSISEAEDVFALTEKPISLIEKLFDKASSGTVPLSSPFSSPEVETSDTVEQPKTSRFAHLFSVEDENATMGFLSLLNSSTPASKLSGGGSPGSPVSTITETKTSSEITGQLGSRLPMPAGPSLEDIEKSLESSTELAADAKSSFPFSPRPEKPPQTFFTCEDLEQSLLAEASDTEWTRDDKRSWKEGDDSDTDASRHLLSLLQKASVRSEDELRVEKKVFEERRIDKEAGVATLEALFGMSFMMELRSTDTPLSAKAVTETSSSSIIQPAKSTTVNELSNVIDGKYPVPSKQSWDLWVSKAGKTGGNSTTGAERSQHLPFDDTRNSLEVDKNPSSDVSKFNVFEDHRSKQENKLGFFGLENGDFGSRSMEQVETGRELNGGRSHSNDELDSGVLNDFLKFKKAIQHRNKVNDSFLGLVDGSTDNTSSMSKEQPERASIDVTSGTTASVAVPATLYRSHSPPLINQKSNSLQLQQLQQALASHGSKALKQQQQQQQQFMFGNGDLGVGDSRYGRTGHSRSGLSRHQQQPAMFPGAHEQQQLHHHPPHFVPPGQSFPSQSSSSFVGPHDVMYNAKQQQQQQQQQRPQAPGYFPPNGSNQPLNNLHLAHGGHHHVPPMSYAGPPPPFGPGFVGYPPPNEGFIGGEQAGERWIGREPHLGAIPGLFQQHQRLYGMNKLGFP